MHVPLMHNTQTSLTGQRFLLRWSARAEGKNTFGVSRGLSVNIKPGSQYATGACDAMRRRTMIGEIVNIPRRRFASRHVPSRCVAQCHRE